MNTSHIYLVMGAILCKGWCQLLNVPCRVSILLTVVCFLHSHKIMYTYESIYVLSASLGNPTALIY